MYCTKCGKEIRDGELYCGACGTKVRENTKVSLSSTESVLSLDNMKCRFENIWQHKGTFLFAFALPIVSMMFLGNTMYNVSYSIFGYESTLYFDMFQGKDFLKTILCIGYVIASVMLVVPAFGDGKWDRKNFIVGEVVPVAAVILLFIGMMSAKNQAAGDQYAYLMESIEAKIKLTANAWIFLVISVAMFIEMNNLCLYTMLDRKRKDKNDKNECIEQFQANMKKDIQEERDVVERIDYEDGSWRCTCGRKNQSYVSTCTCGKSKHQLY